MRGTGLDVGAHQDREKRLALVQGAQDVPPTSIDAHDHQGPASPHRRMTRRFALCLVGGAALALPAGFQPRGVDARIAWCRTDPVVELKDPTGSNGNSAAIYLSAAMEDWELTDSSGEIIVEHPAGANTNTLWEDPNGYFGQGISTTFASNKRLDFSTTGMEIEVRCYIPAVRNNMKIKVEWAPGPIVFDESGTPLLAPVTASTVGHSNKWIVVRAELPYA